MSQDTFFELGIWQPHKYFLRRTSRSKDSSFSLPRNLIGGLHSSTSTQFSRISPRREWKTLSVKLPRENFLSSESDNHLSSFFVEQPDQNFLLFLNLLGEIHTYNSPQFSRINSRLDWKTLFVKLIRENFFSSNSGNHPSTFFRVSTKSNIPSLLKPARRDTLLRQPSVQ